MLTYLLTLKSYHLVLPLNYQYILIPKEKRQEITDLHFDLKYPNHFLSFFVSTGVALGAGWQSTVAYVNIACYYLIGIPVGVVLGYVVNLQVKVSAFFFTHFNKYYYMSN